MGIDTHELDPVLEPSFPGLVPIGREELGELGNRVQWVLAF